MVFIKKFSLNPFQENTYLISIGKSAVIIDPGMSNYKEEAEIIDYLDKNQLELKEVWLTHAHIDHIMGLNFIQTQFNIPMWMHSKELDNLNAAEMVAKNYGIPFIAFKNKQFTSLDNITAITFENEVFEVLQTPGHSAGSVSFYHKNSNQLIAGDVLFFQSIGRTDLPGGDYNTLEKTIKETLYLLPDETIVFSGHGTETSIGYEKMSNSFFRA